MWMNEHEIDEMAERFIEHPVLGPATRTLSNLRDAVNSNSDGWPHWSAPVNAAKKLMQLITGDGTTKYLMGPREDATPEKLRAALTPIKSFRTKRGLQFEIVEKLEDVTEASEQRSFDDFMRTVLAVFPQAQVEPDNDGQLMVYTGWRYVEDDMVVPMDQEQEKA